MNQWRCQTQGGPHGQYQTTSASAGHVAEIDKSLTPSWKFWVPYLIGVIYALFSYAPALGTWGLLLTVAWPITLFIAIYIPIKIADLLARSKRDYPLYKKYKSALAHYAVVLREWERRHVGMVAATRRNII